MSHFSPRRHWIALCLGSTGARRGQRYTATGRFDRSAAALAATRALEAAAGAEVLGMGSVPTIRGFEDAETTTIPEVDIRLQIAAAIRRFLQGRGLSWRAPPIAPARPDPQPVFDYVA